MAHVFVFVEGRKVWMDLFLSDLSKRLYHYKLNNGMLGYIMPNAREIKLLDISVPEGCIPQLMGDLHPIALNTSFLRGKARLLSKVLRFLGKLKPVEKELYPLKWKSNNRILNQIKRRLAIFLFKRGIGIWEEIPYQTSGQVRHRWINIIPIGYGDDPKHSDSGLPMLPVGGELI